MDCKIDGIVTSYFALPQGILKASLKLALRCLLEGVNTHDVLTLYLVTQD